jgi:hypothetical protein
VTPSGSAAKEIVLDDENAADIEDGDRVDEEDDDEEYDHVNRIAYKKDPRGIDQR